MIVTVTAGTPAASAAPLGFGTGAVALSSLVWRQHRDFDEVRETGAESRLTGAGRTGWERVRLQAVDCFECGEKGDTVVRPVDRVP
ncbi:hypothetical protein ABTX62_05725 [Streptomyces sp. NPDC096046]|uniref:hypothetical protein n=1 Tax=Streptomyces sp. NPDC096046 TaxID=3155542 RepID=UPI003316DF61